MVLRTVIANPSCDEEQAELYRKRRLLALLSVSQSASRPPAGDPSALVVLVEEELVVIDLQTEGWPVIQTPYLVPLHCSAITCSHHVSAIPLKLWERILAAGDLQQTHYSKKVSTVSIRDEQDSKTLDRSFGWTWSEVCF